MRYSGGTIIHEQIDAGTRVSLINELKDAAVDAGWSAEGIPAHALGSFSGLPSNGQAVWIGSQQYTFVATLSAAYQVKIGTTAAECAANFYDAIMDNSANEGVTYGTGTAAHPDVYAEMWSSTAVNVLSNTVGPGQPFTVGQNISNFGWTYAGNWTAFGGGWKLTSQRNESGHYMWFRLIDYVSWNTTNVAVFFGDPVWDYWTYYNTNFHVLVPSTSRVLEVIGSKYAIWVCLLGTNDPAAGVHMTASLLYVRDFLRPKVVVSVSNNGGAIQVNLDAAHGLVDGDHVNVAYGTGLTAVNGRHEITVVDSDSYVLNGTTYASGYVANSARAGSQREVTRCFVGFANAAWGRWGLRDSLHNGLSGMTYGFNQFSYRHGSASISMVANRLISYSGSCYRILNLGGAADVLEGRFGWAVTGSGQRFYVGEFYDAFLADATAPLDTMLYDFDGKNWFCYCAGGDYSLWIVDGVAS